MRLLSRLVAALRRWRAEPGGAPAPLVATASHEIRTPLAGMIGMAELLAETPLAPDQRSYVDGILASGRALAELVDGLLDVASLDAGRLEVVERAYDPRALMQGVVELLAPQAQGKGLEISCRVDRAVPARLLGDAVRLRQVLLNLAGNGVKFTDSGGLVVRTGRSADRLIVAVEDTGAGVPESRRAAIFAPFERGAGGSEAPGGTGLGLPIARRLAEAMGGRLDLARSGPQGSTFRLDLPLKIAPDAGEAARPAGDGARLDGLSVLFVSALPFEAGSLAESLGAAGARAAVVAAPDPGALAADQRPDVLVVDASLGEEVALRLAADARVAGIARRLVLVSPFARPAQGELLAAFDGWLVKPVRLESLFARIRPPPPDAAGAPPSERCATGRALAGLHILVAEDDPVNGRLAEARLGRLGARVTRVSDGTAALAAWTAAATTEDPARHFDAALLDISMPGLDGAGVARRIRALERQAGRAAARLVALTAGTKAAADASIQSAGFDAVLTKPADSEALARALRPVATPAAMPPRDLLPGAA